VDYSCVTFAIKERRTLVAVAITLIVVVGFGIWVWPSQSESTAKIVTPSGSQPAGGPKQPPDTPASCPVVPELTDEQRKVNPKDQLNYVRIPNGKFMMGCPDGSECNDYEKPQHLVTIRKGFWMGQTEATVMAYKRYVRDTGRYMPPAPNFDVGWQNDRMPIENVSWEEAYRYCKWADGRLPTEAEWEYAARGGTRGARYGEIDDIAWYVGNSFGQSHEVMRKCPNDFHLYDMLGNVSEWVNDWYANYQPNAENDSTGPNSGRDRVLRGLSSGNYALGVRVSNREWANQGSRHTGHGFRCVWETGNP